MAACTFCVWMLLVVICVLELDVCELTVLFSREQLLHIGSSYQVPITGDFWSLQQIPAEITRPLTSPWFTLPGNKPRRRWREGKQKRGCRSGHLARLRRAPSRPPLPSLFVANARSLCNKMDELRLDLSSRSTSSISCVMIITETWLNPEIPDTTIELTGRSIHSSDRTKDW